MHDSPHVTPSQAKRSGRRMGNLTFQTRSQAFSFLRLRLSFSDDAVAPGRVACESQAGLSHLSGGGLASAEKTAEEAAIHPNPHSHNPWYRKRGQVTAANRGLVTITRVGEGAGRDEIGLDRVIQTSAPRSRLSNFASGAKLLHIRHCHGAFSRCSYQHSRQTRESKRADV